MRRFNDSIAYVLPKLLLVVSAWTLRAGGATGVERASRPFRPMGILPGSGKLSLVDAHPADPDLQALFSQVQTRHGWPLVSSYYRGLANWPDVFARVWAAVAPVIDSPGYNGARDQVVAAAAAHVAQWPLAGLPAPTDKVLTILQAFRAKFIPEMMLDLAMIRALVDDVQMARQRPFFKASSPGEE